MITQRAQAKLAIVSSLIMSAIALAVASQALGAEGSSSSSSKNFMGGRAGIAVGGWKGTFSETYKNQTSEFAIKPAWAGTFFLGANVGMFFLEYSPMWQAVPKIHRSDSGASNAYRFAWFGVDAGVSLKRYIPFLPLEAYLGYENRGVKFQNGTQDELGGNALKLGVNVPIRIKDTDYLGVKAEYRKHFLYEDNDGHVPDSVGVSFTSYFLGVMIMFSD